MRLTLKLVLAFVLGNILLATIYGYVAVRRVVRFIQHEVSTEAAMLGRAMQDPLTEAWRTAGRQGLLQLVRRASDERPQQLHVRWVWFDATEDDPDVPAAPHELLTTIVIEQHTAIETLGPDGEPYLHAYWPVALNTPRRGGLEFAHSAKAMVENQRDIMLRTAVLIGGMVLLSGLLAAVLGVRLVGRPLRRLTEKTRCIAVGEFHDPVHLRTHDELAELAESLNAMCAQLSASHERIRAETAARIAALEQLRHADRLQTVGRLAAGIAHELGTPLNVVSGRADLIASGKLGADEIGASAAAIKAEAGRMTKIIRQLLDFARAGEPRKAAVDLRQAIGQTVDLLRAMAEKHRVRLLASPGDGPAIAELDAGQIQQVLTNLVVNAIQAMPQGGTAEITVRRQAARPPAEVGGPEGMYYCIEVCDQGVGIPAENLPHLFEPFFTTKTVGEGTGLGLSIAYGIVQEHGGWIDVASRPGEGSCFRVFLPEGAKS